jgi:hypothetical protein
MYSGGSGTELDPYLISTPQDLIDIKNNLNAYFKQTNNIDLASYNPWSPIGEGVGIIGINYDGDGFAIQNLTCNRDGLFYQFGGTVKNLKIEDFYGYTTSAEPFGPIAFRLEGTGVVQNCFCTGSFSTNTSLSNNISSGGIVGTCNGTIKNCRSDVSVYVKSTKDDMFIFGGGIAGSCLGTCVVENCIANGDVKVGGDPAGSSGGFYDNVASAGGIFATGDGTVKYCVANMENITSLLSEDELYFDRITNNFSSGGSFLPRDYSPTIISNYALNTMNTPNTIVSNLNGTSGLDKTSSELQKKSTYESLGWDFNNVWAMVSGKPIQRIFFEKNTEGSLFFGTNF